MNSVIGKIKYDVWVDCSDWFLKKKVVEPILETCPGIGVVAYGASRDVDALFSSTGVGYACARLARRYIRRTTMSSSRVPPDSDSGLLDWASSFSSYVQAHFAALEVSSDTASDLTAKFNAYQGALENSNNPETRGPAKVLQKNLRKSELLELCRPLAVQINANPNVTDEQRQALGLKIRDRHPTPSPVPTTPPKVGIVNFGGNTLKVTLSDQDVLKRGKPPHVTGAAIYFWVGEETPTENTPWIAFANTGRTMFNMEFPSSLPAGTKVWIIAAWSNSRGQFGPSCQPISALLLGQMEFQQGNLKLAA